MQSSYAAARAALALAALLGTVEAQTVPQRLTLGAAVDLALAQRRELTAADAAIRSFQGAAAQAARRPNPVLSFQSEDWRAWQSPSLSPRNDLELFAFLTDTIETGGKRRLRAAAAERRTDAVEIERAVAAWSIRREVAEAWRRAAGAAERVGLLAQSRRTVADLVRFLQTRFDLGAAAEVDVIKVRVEEERLAAAVAAAETAAEQARLELLGAMGVPAASAAFEVMRQAPPEVGESSPSPEQAARLALEGRPDLAVERALLAAAQAVVELERANAQPNLNPYFGYKRSGPFNTLVGGVSVPLPIRDRNQGRIAEAVAEVERAEAVLHAAEARAQAEARAAAVEVERRRALVESLRAGARERAAETFRIASAAYQEQGADLLFLLDARRTLDDIELLYAQSVLDYRLSQDRLGAATGYAASTGGVQ